MSNPTRYNPALLFAPGHTWLSQETTLSMQGNATSTSSVQATSITVNSADIRTHAPRFAERDSLPSGVSTSPQLIERDLIHSGIATAAHVTERNSLRLGISTLPHLFQRDPRPSSLLSIPSLVERDSLLSGISTASVSSFVKPKPVVSPDVTQRMTFWDTVLGENFSETSTLIVPPPPPVPVSARKTNSFLDIVLNKDMPIPKITPPTITKEIEKRKRKRKVNMARVFKCGECTSAFKRKYDLTQHVDAVHLKKQPYKCDECPKSFAHNGTKRKHVRTVHRREKPFICGINGCNRMFSEKGNLNKHIARKLRKLRENGGQ